MTDSLNKHQLRRAMRRHRASLSNSQLIAAQNSLANQARKSNRLLQAQYILSYAPFAGEISPAKLVDSLACATVHLPRITNFRLSQMRFYSADNVDTMNKYGIEEPRAIGAPWPANHFDLLLVPLVAFDRSGTRLGMGAGYYDRALEALSYQTSTKPYLIGLAHHFQEVNSLAREPWDVPLDAILTDRELIQIQLKNT
jgi:5-formyltetrahydrofolate cyclo-ligase